MKRKQFLPTLPDKCTMHNATSVYPDPLPQSCQLAVYSESKAEKQLKNS
jgi:hypothetical protein